MLFLRKKSYLKAFIIYRECSPVAVNEVDLEFALGCSWRPLYRVHVYVFVGLAWFQTQSTRFVFFF